MNPRYTPPKGLAVRAPWVRLTKEELAQKRDIGSTYRVHLHEFGLGSREVRIRVGLASENHWRTICDIVENRFFYRPSDILAVWGMWSDRQHTSSADESERPYPAE